MFSASQGKQSLSLVEFAEYTVVLTVAVATMIGLLRAVGLLG
jgi:hypothetical protein